MTSSKIVNPEREKKDFICENIWYTIIEIRRTGLRTVFYLLFFFFQFFFSVSTMQNQMFNEKWETMIAIVIGMLLISIIIVGIMTLLTKNYEISNDYDRNNMVFILKNNGSNILRKLDTSGSNEWEVFYIYKNPDVKEFQVIRNSSPDKEMFKYINSDWEVVVNTGSYTDGSIYTRIFFTEKKAFENGTTKQIIKWSIKELIRRQ
jgi:hypothetical protein